MYLAKIKIRIILLFLMIGSSTIIAQQRTGNIVEYFGKEKVNDIKEGKAIACF